MAWIRIHSQRARKRLEAMGVNVTAYYRQDMSGRYAYEIPDDSLPAALGVRGVNRMACTKRENPGMYVRCWCMSTKPDGR
jgi:hypothetical protein